jgi:hypothetical protein
VLFGDSFIDPFNNPSMDSWIHIVARSMGIYSHIPHIDPRQTAIYRNLPIGESISFGSIKSYSLQGSSIEYSQAQLMHYIKNDYSEQDVIIYGITDYNRLPFINNEFNKQHGFGYSFKTNNDYDMWLYYSTDKEKHLKALMISYILNTLPNKKILIDCFDNTRYGYDWHIQGNLYDLSLSELGGDRSSKAFPMVDHRPNHFGTEYHRDIGDRFVRFLDGDYSITLSP